MTQPTGRDRFDFRAPVPPADDLGRVHFIAIGGAGMSGVARIMLGRGIAVSGSYAADSAVLRALEEQGATVKVAENWEENVQVDERLVTGQNPQSAAGVAKEMTKLLTEVVREQKAEEEQVAQELRAEHDAAKAAVDDED